MSVLTIVGIATFIAANDAAVRANFTRMYLALKSCPTISGRPNSICNGTSLRMQKDVKYEPQVFTVLGWHVDDIDAAMADLRERGVVFEQYPWMAPDSNGVMEFPGGAKVAWFKDPDGNVLSLDQY